METEESADQPQNAEKDPQDMIDLISNIKYQVFTNTLTFDEVRNCNGCCILIRCLMELLKVAMVITQLVKFGQMRSNHVEFIDTSRVTFENLYLWNWSTEREVVPYPPNSGRFAIYRIPDFYKSVDYTLTKYNLTTTEPIGFYSFNNNTKEPVQMCVLYAASQVSPNCFPLGSVHNGTHITYDTKEYLKNQTLDFHHLKSVKLMFSLEAKQLKDDDIEDTEDCWNFSITILYNNRGRNGQLTIELIADDQQKQCPSDVGKSVYLTDVLVIILCLASLVWFMCTVYQMLQLRKKTEKYMKEKYSKGGLTSKDRSKFVNKWFLFIILTDLLLIIGSIWKMAIDLRLTRQSHDYEWSGVFMGTGNLFLWISFLRLFQYSTKFSVLLQTMEKAGPDVFAYLTCAVFLYMGFAVCGWIMIGPYYSKFRTLGSTISCLFSLICGDEIYVTLANIQLVHWSFGWFGCIYVFTFVSMFIYVIISVFIAIIEKAYEVIRERYKDTEPEERSQLEQFLHSSRETKNHLVPRDENNLMSEIKQKVIWLMCCGCLPPREQGEGDESHERLITPINRSRGTYGSASQRRPENPLEQPI